MMCGYDGDLLDHVDLPHLRSIQLVGLYTMDTRGLWSVFSRHQKTLRNAHIVTSILAVSHLPYRQGTEKWPSFLGKVATQLEITSLVLDNLMYQDNYKRSILRTSQAKHHARLYLREGALQPAGDYRLSGTGLKAVGILPVKDAISDFASSVRSREAELSDGIP